LLPSNAVVFTGTGGRIVRHSENPQAEEGSVWVSRGYVNLPCNGLVPDVILRTTAPSLKKGSDNVNYLASSTIAVRHRLTSATEFCNDADWQLHGCDNPSELCIWQLSLVTCET